MDQLLTDLLWSKIHPRKSLFGHLRETATVMKCLLENSSYSDDRRLLAEWLGLTEEDTLAFCQYLAAMHDIGKCHPLFQGKEPEMDEYLRAKQLAYPVTDGYRHETGSKLAAFRIWRSEKRFDKEVSCSFSYILSLHHQGKKCVGQIPKLEDLVEWPGASEWISQQNAIEQRLYDAYKPPFIEEKQIAHVDAACTLLTGLVIMSDWIASSEVLAGDLDPLTDDELEGKVSEIIQGMGLSDVQLTDCRTYHERFPWITEDSTRPLQRTVETLLSQRTDMPCLMILEAPMGEGKTEAGLFAANRMAYGWHKKGLYVGLPTAATSNQMIGRVNNMLTCMNGYSARLLHSMAWLEDDSYEKAPASDVTQDLAGWLMPTRKALLAPFAVGTVDQVLMAVLRVKYGVLRLLGLTDKVLVIDEIHAYDAYMTEIMERLVEWCRILQTPVVMLSATLPEDKKQRYLNIYSPAAGVKQAYPMVTAAYADGTVIQQEVNGSYKRGCIGIRVAEADPDHEQVAGRVVAMVADGGCLCVLVNTVKTAQTVYRKIKESGTDAQVMLFHARFSAARRQEIEQECLTLFGKPHEHRPRKAILVATQVVEQSLDIDFDAMITEIAPMDLILQRMGRLHRHDDTVRPEKLRESVLDVILPRNGEYGATEKIYCPLFLTRTADMLRSVTQIAIPEDIPRMVNEVYQTNLMDDGEREDWLKQQFDTDMQKGQAQVCELFAPQETTFGLGENGRVFYEDGEDSFLSAKTRLGEEMVRLAVVPDELYRQAEQCLKDAFVPQNIAKELMRHSVSVSTRSVKDVEWTHCLEGTGKLCGMKILPCIGAVAAPTDTLTAQTSSHTIILDREYGLLIRERGENI